MRLLFLIHIRLLGTKSFSNPLVVPIKIIFEYLPRAYENGANDPEAREKMANAATMAGMAFANAFLGLCHSMAHKLGAYHHIPHGIANAMLLPTVLEFNGEVCYERYQDILKALGYPAEKYTKEETIKTLENNEALKKKT